MVNEMKEKWDFKERKELFTCSKCGQHSMDLSYGPNHPGVCPNCLIKENLIVG